MSLAASLEKSQLKRLQAEKVKIGSIRKIPQKNGYKKNLLAAMSLKGPEVSLDAAHRDPGSSSTYVT